MALDRITGFLLNCMHQSRHKLARFPQVSTLLGIQLHCKLQVDFDTACKYLYSILSCYFRHCVGRHFENELLFEAANINQES